MPSQGHWVYRIAALVKQLRGRDQGRWLIMALKKIHRLRYWVYSDRQNPQGGMTACMYDHIIIKYILGLLHKVGPLQASTATEPAELINTCVQFLNWVWVLVTWYFFHLIHDRLHSQNVLLQCLIQRTRKSTKQKLFGCPPLSVVAQGARYLVSPRRRSNGPESEEWRVLAWILLWPSHFLLRKLPCFNQHILLTLICILKPLADNSSGFDLGFGRALKKLSSLCWLLLLLSPHFLACLANTSIVKVVIASTLSN